MKHTELNTACVLNANTGFTSKSTQMLCSHHCIVSTEAIEQSGVNDVEHACRAIKNNQAKKINIS